MDRPTDAMIDRVRQLKYIVHSKQMSNKLVELLRARTTTPHCAISPKSEHGPPSGNDSIAFEFPVTVSY